MKYFAKGFLVSGIVVSFAFVMHNHSDKNGKGATNYATQVIRVSLDPSGNGLILDDGKNKGGNITTKVNKKTVIKWRLDNQSGITSLDSIVSKNGVDLFDMKPSKENDKLLTGRIGDFPSGTEEEYGIWYSVDGVSYMHDPKIQIH
ncbi:MAG: hypothetical protein ACRC6O_09100 [Flavobacterium sp.]